MKIPTVPPGHVPVHLKMYLPQNLSINPLAWAWPVAVVLEVEEVAVVVVVLARAAVVEAHVYKRCMHRIYKPRLNI
jgi:hypothetical protein